MKTPFARLKLTVTQVLGECYHGYKIGDEIILEDFTHGPKHFCLGLAHALFPVIYALSFGAKFGFRDNQRSLLVTCPDGGKLEFKAEILDQQGNVEILPSIKVTVPLPSPPHKGEGIETESLNIDKVTAIFTNHKGPQPKKMILEVARAKGKCAFGYKVGDKWETAGLKCIPGFCGAAFHTAFPALFALNFGAKFHFMDNPDAIDTVTCPDGGNIVFRVTRVE
ncbi:MAG: TIGR04076 family protein [Candidatus Omnitrophica bacterium]|nr:TIGR04076 family protein [Candidatus Omnitrophota bacterium]